LIYTPVLSDLKQNPDNHIKISNDSEIDWAATPIGLGFAKENRHCYSRTQFDSEGFLDVENNGVCFPSTRRTSLKVRIDLFFFNYFAFKVREMQNSSEVFNGILIITSV
jgi:hypothetical protein